MRWFVIIPAIVLSWLAIAASAMLPGSIQTAAIAFPSTDLLANLPHHIAILDAGPHMLVVHSESPDYVRELYQAGAVLVVPARKTSCISFQD